MGSSGWEIRSDLGLDGGLGQQLIRDIGSFSSLPNQSNINTLLGEPDFFSFGNISDPATYGGFWIGNEFGPHALGHNWFSSGGMFAHMSHMYASVNDPMFFLHHCNVDRIWAMWQRNGHRGTTNFASGLPPGSQWPYGSNLGNLMFPWIGSASGFGSVFLDSNSGIDFPDFSSEPGVTAADVLDHRKLGYAYDTEPVVGLALDRTGSMTGLTPNPLTGAPPNQSKWEAAKQGMSAFLQDSETALTAGEAYVTAGIETFRTNGGINEFTKIFGGIPYGLIKNGTTYSRATFESNVTSLDPEGGTPIAGALTDTENTLVRTPFGGQPANETRYLCILTDGKETATPYLSSLSTPAFPDTIIFAMGFGIGSGWNGVDYTTLQTIVDKGTSAPMGVQQVFHGEDTNTINKFYTNSVAHTIGFTPMTDPTYELFPGESSVTMFDATDNEQSFMIVAVGFDFNKKNWDFKIQSPDGNTYTQSSQTPFLITFNQHQTRVTVFINRNGSSSSKWIGRWRLIASYKMRQTQKIISKHMATQHPWNLALPTGSLPVRGPLFAWALDPKSVRQPIRTIVDKSSNIWREINLISVSGDDRSASSLSVNIFAKTTIKSQMVAQSKIPYAGNDIQVQINLDPDNKVSFDDIRVVGRLVAPAFSIGNAYADLKSLPLKERKKFFKTVGKTQIFDELMFLAEFERRNQGVFKVRNEPVKFELKKEGRTLVGKITGNRYPGVYKIGALVTGKMYRSEKEKPEQFSRVLNTEIALGILLDFSNSKPIWRWINHDTAGIVFTPTDKWGNVASPARMARPEIVIEGKRIVSEHINDLSGQHLLKIKFDNVKGKRLMDTNGITIVSSEATLTYDGREKIKCTKNMLRSVVIIIGEQKLQVYMPQIVGDKISKKAYYAGSEKAMQIPINASAVFSSMHQAKEAGFDFDTKDNKQR